MAAWPNYIKGHSTPCSNVAGDITAKVLRALIILRTKVIILFYHRNAYFNQNTLQGRVVVFFLSASTPA